MMMRTIPIAAVLLLAASSVRADDTYNFYFQKAPGPVTVNQGGTAGTPKAENVVVPAAAASSSAPAPAAEEAFSQRKFELTFGMAALRTGDSTSQPYGYSSSPSTGAIQGNQYSLGAQYNFTENFGLEAQAFYLTSTPAHESGGLKEPGTGSLLDYGANFVVTPFRLHMGSSTRFALSGLVGAVTVPFELGSTPSPSAINPPWNIGHAGSFTYGARFGLEFFNRYALEGTIRKITRFSSTQSGVTLAFLL